MVPHQRLDPYFRLMEHNYSSLIGWRTGGGQFRPPQKHNSANTTVAWLRGLEPLTNTGEVERSVQASSGDPSHEHVYIN